MAETLPIRKRIPAYNTVFHQFTTNEVNVDALQQDAYLRGYKDGEKDLEIELIKRGKALFQIALQKATDITNDLLETAEGAGILVYSFHLKMEDWDKVTSLIVVKLEDYVDDKIDVLYARANELTSEYNTESFHWSYLITYASEKLNREKILTDGFTFLYEHTPAPCPA